MQAPVEPVSTSRKDMARLMRLATYASLAVALILVFGKTIAWITTDSVSLLATLLDSILDGLASLINLFAVRHAITPADKEHRFGHGKAEALAGLAQAAFIVGSIVFLLLEAGKRLIDPVPAESYGLGLAVMICSIVLTSSLMLFQQYVIRKTDSTAIKADALHYRTDLLVNVTVIVALVLAAKGWGGFDALFALGIAFFILYSAWGILSQSLNDLMDRELPLSERDAITAIALSHSKVIGVHDLRTRRSGIATFVQLHLEVNDELTLLEAHTISDEVELSLQDAYPAAEIIMHLDPISIVPFEPVPSFLKT